MNEGDPFSIDSFDGARKHYPLADVEIHDGALVVSPRPDQRAHDVIEDLVKSLLPHIESEDHGFWIEGSATVEFDDRNIHFYALAVWTIDPETVPALVIHVMSAYERMRWTKTRLQRATELGAHHALLVDPATRSFMTFTESGHSEVLTEGVPFADMLPNWSLDAETLFRAPEE